METVESCLRIWWTCWIIKSTNARCASHASVKKGKKAVVKIIAGYRNPLQAPIRRYSLKKRNLHFSINIISVSDSIVLKGKKVSLRCSICKTSYAGAWDLMFHVQSVHDINIYNIKDKKKASQEVWIQSNMCSFRNVLTRNLEASWHWSGWFTLFLKHQR